MAQALDIKNYEKADSDKPAIRTQEVVVQTPLVEFSIGIGAIPRGIILNVHLQSNGDRTLYYSTVKLVNKAFSKFLLPGHRGHQTHQNFAMLLSNVHAKEIEANLHTIKSAIAARTQNPMDTLPASLRNKSESERIEFIKALLTKAIIEQGISNNQLFFERNLNTIHKLFIGSLSTLELSVAHYSMFDRGITYEAQMQISKRIDELNRTQEILGEKKFDELDIIESIRSKFFTVSKSVHDAFVKHQEQLFEAQKTLEDYRTMRFEERAAELYDKIASIEKEKTQLEKSMTFKKTVNYFPFHYTSKGTWSSENPEVRTQHARLEKEISDRHRQLSLLARKRADQIATFNAKQIEALQVLELDRRNNNGSNYNPYAVEADYNLASLGSSVHHRYVQAAVSPHRITESSLSSSISNSPQLNKSALDTPNYGSFADSTVLLKNSGMSKSMVEVLDGFGIRSVLDLTQIAARDYIEKLGMSLPTFERLLDELNVIGVHVHFDNKWDRENHRIRARRPEYYEFRHTPRESGNLRWEDPHKTDRRDPLDNN